MPLKRAVIPLLDEISETAASVEAVNTVVFTEDGRRVGDNTDIPGMVAALRERGIEQVDSAADPRRGRHRLLRARRARPDLHRRGHRVRPQRGPGRARCGGWGERLGVDGAYRRLGGRRRGLRAPLVIATTPAGTTDALAAAVPERPGTLFDVLYDPWPTALAAAWSARGGAVVGGLDLLVHQAVLQVEQMTGRVAGARWPRCARRARRRSPHALTRPAGPGPWPVPRVIPVALVRPWTGGRVPAPDVGGSEVAGQGRAPGPRPYASASQAVQARA